MQDEKDRFWDLGALLPPRRPTAPAPVARPVRTVPVFDAAPAASAPSASAPEEEGRITVMAVGEEEASSYVPGWNPLLLSVRILRREAGYHFYGQFRRDAERYFDRTGEMCPFVPFFSYIPQYAQLSKEQLAYYLYWRSCVRQGEYPPCEESYFYLYVYEIINLPDRIPPEQGVLLLCRAWAAYRTTFPRIDKYLAEWVCDYCLVHALPCPRDLLRPFLGALLPYASLREFYLGGIDDLAGEGLETALAFFSDYRFQDSRYAQGEHRPLFEQHIAAAVRPVIQTAFSEEGLFRTVARTTRVHEAFCGSLCAHQIRCRIAVTYLAIPDVAPLRQTVTAAVKYAENCLRSLLSIKSRLAVPPLSPHHRARIDAYFATARAAICPARPEEIPAYEKYYEAPARGVHFDAAAQIERASWDTTRILVPEEETAEAPACPQAPSSPVPPAPVRAAPPPAGQGAVALAPEACAYLRACLHADRAAVRTVLASCAMLEEEMIDRINDICARDFGDVILEQTEQGGQIIPDYAGEVAEWIQ